MQNSMIGCHGIASKEILICRLTLYLEVLKDYISYMSQIQSTEKTPWIYFEQYWYYNMLLQYGVSFEKKNFGWGGVFIKKHYFS